MPTLVYTAACLLPLSPARLTLGFCGCYPLLISGIFCKTPAFCPLVQISLAQGYREWQAFTEGLLSCESWQHSKEQKTTSSTKTTVVIIPQSWLTLGISCEPFFPSLSLLPYNWPPCSLPRTQCPMALEADSHVTWLASKFPLLCQLDSCSVLTLTPVYTLGGLPFITLKSPVRPFPKGKQSSLREKKFHGHLGTPDFWSS